MKYKKSLFEMVSKRKRSLSVQTESVMNIISSHEMRRPITHENMRAYINGINGSVTINNMGKQVLYTLREYIEDNKAYSATGPIYTNINSYVNDIIPKYQNLQEAIDCLEGFIDDDTLKPYLERVIETAKEYKQCDRIIKNQNAINKRFNLSKFIKESYFLDREEIVKTLCEFVDTYNRKPEEKYNLALENIPYTFYESGISNQSNDIYDYITEYFLLRQDVLTDSYMRKLRNIMNKSFIPESVKESLNKDYFFNEHYFGKMVDSFLESLGLKSINEINSEKKASEYISYIVDEVSNIDEAYMYNEKSNRAFNMLCSIPYMSLSINLSEAFIESQIVNQMNMTKNPYIKEALEKLSNTLESEGIRYFSNELVGQYSLIESVNEISINMKEASKWKEKFTDKVTNVKNKVIGTPDSGEKDFKTLMKNFKAEQNKDASGFKKLLNSLYAKTPTEILNETPHVLGLVRAVFVLSSVAVPVIGPVLMVVNSFFDKLISIHFDSKQTVALHKYIKNELNTVEKKIDEEKDEEAKVKLQKYRDVLDKNIKKVEEYKRKEFDDLVDIDTSDNSDDDLDLGDLDFDLESVIDNDKISVIKESVQNPELNYMIEFSYYLDSMKIVSEWTENNKMNKLLEFNKDYISSNIRYMAPILARCKHSIDYNHVSDMVLECFDPVGMEYSSVYSLLEAHSHYDGINTTRDIIIERECLDTISQVLTEGFKLNDLKLVFKDLKNKVKNLSVKEKEISQTINMYANTFINSMEKAMTSDRREAIIKGNMIPSFSKCLKIGITLGGVTLLNPILGLISAIGFFACSKALNHRERQLIYDEIETELKVVEKEISIAENDNDMKRYRFLLNYQKKLQRERQRIRYNMKVQGRPIPSANPVHKEDE